MASSTTRRRQQTWAAVCWRLFGDVDGGDGESADPEQ
jgi:hypothetical protein